MLLLVILLLAASAGGLPVGGGAGTSLQCLDENNYPVDWYILYKLPTAVSFGSSESDTAGDDYLYLLPGQTQWTFSKRSIADPGSLLGTTLNNFFKFFKPKTTVEYKMYNDAVPYKEARVDVGHTKGVAAYDASTNAGFWIIHSVPGFPKPSFDGAFEMFRYPGSGFVNGQIALCISFSSLEAWSQVKNQVTKNDAKLFKSNPNTPSKMNYSTGVQMGIPCLENNYCKVELIQTRTGGPFFTSFAKNNLFNGDLYSDLVAPYLKTSLFVQTWWNKVTVLPSSCIGTYKVFNIAEISIKDPQPVFTFSQTKDHGKWAVSKDPALPWVCIGDINRTASQKKRGGGTVCLNDKNVWTVFNNMVSKFEACKIVEESEVYDYELDENRSSLKSQ